jgi:hypothetical protein
VPVFTNRKYGEPFPIRIKSASGWRYTREEILKLFPPVIKRRRPIFAPGSAPGRSARPPARLRALIDVVANAKKGDRNCLLFWSANRLREMAVLGEVTKAEFTQACNGLVQAATSVGLSTNEARRTIHSALR